MLEALLSPTWQAIFIEAGYAAVIATGLYFSNSAGALSVAHAAFAGMGGYMSAVLTTNFGWPFGLAIGAGIILGFAAGVFLALITLRMDPLVSSLTTLAFGAAIGVIAFNTQYIGGGQSFAGIPPLTNLPEAYLGLALVLFLSWRFDKSRLGLAALACRANEVAASAMGIPVGRVKIEVFAIGAGVAALGGALRAHFILVENPNDLGFWVSVNYLIFWIFGGSYSFWGPAAGAIILTIVPEFLRFSDAERFVLYGLLLTAFVILRPDGLVRRRSTGVSSSAGLKRAFATAGDAFHVPRGPRDGR